MKRNRDAEESWCTIVVPKCSFMRVPICPSNLPMDEMLQIVAQCIIQQTVGDLRTVCIKMDTKAGMLSHIELVRLPAMTWKQLFDNLMNTYTHAVITTDTSDSNTFVKAFGQGYFGQGTEYDLKSLRDLIVV